MFIEVFGKNNNFNKVSSKRELKEKLNDIEGILNKNIVEYLDSLIELDYSVIRSNISDKERITLTQLELYKKIAIYNIYYRTANIFKGKSNIVLRGNNKGNEGLNVYRQDDENIELFDFDYSDEKNLIGNITLFKTVIDEDARNKALDHVMKTLEALYDAKNPYHDRPGVFGGPGSRWYFDHAKTIERYEELFNKLDRKEFTKEEKREAKITQKYHDILMDEFGLKEEEFKEEKRFVRTSFDESKKILVKKLPGITISSETTYL